MTPDVAASKRFYGEVFGWKFEDMPMNGFAVGAKQVASITPTTAGVPTHGLTYVVVDELASARVTVTDKVGATICLFKGQG